MKMTKLRHYPRSSNQETFDNHSLKVCLTMTKFTILNWTTFGRRLTRPVLLAHYFLSTGWGSSSKTPQISTLTASVAQKVALNAGGTASLGKNVNVPWPLIFHTTPFLSYGFCYFICCSSHARLRTIPRLFSTIQEARNDHFVTSAQIMKQFKRRTDDDQSTILKLIDPWISKIEMSHRPTPSLEYFPGSMRV
jgi:hypothetical protein